VILLIYSRLSDPVSEALWRWCGAAGVRCDRLVLSDEWPVAGNQAVVRSALRSGDAVVGVGLAGSLLLALGDLPEEVPGVRLLALFPYLGVNADPYGAGDGTAVWADRWLRLARWPLLRLLLGRVALTPAPRGLEGVLARHRMSWRHVAAALVSTDFTGLLLAARSPVTVVLNQASPELRRERAGLVFSALNERLALAFADPAAPALPAQVGRWLQGHRFDDPSLAAHA
jgi:hypothetical protein